MASTSKCAVCDSPSTMVCAGCKDHLDDKAAASQTSYCSRECQESHWKTEHKKSCKNVNITTRLFRAGELLHKVFYEYRKVAFDLDIMRVEKKDGKLAIYQSDYNDGKGPLYRFPSHLIDTPEDEKALLSLTACNDAVGFLHPLMTKVMSVVAPPETSLCEWETPPTSHTLSRILNYRGGALEQLDTDELQHRVVCVSLRIPRQEGDKPDLSTPAGRLEALVGDFTPYVLDLAGAQFNQFKPVISREESGKLYRESVGNVIVSPEDYGYLASKIENTAHQRAGPKIGPFNASSFEVFLGQYRIARTLDESVDKWLLNSGKTFRGLLTSKRPDFVSGTDQLVQKVAVDMAKEVDAVLADHVKVLGQLLAHMGKTQI